MRPDESGAREEGGGAIGSPLSVSLRHSVSSSPPCSTLRSAMLPWRKSKFVLVEDEAASKPKSPGAGLTCHALLSSLLHSCPYLLPDCPLRWLGGVFRSRRHKVELNRDQPVYSVRYLGSAVTIAAKGDGCTQDAVAKIWARSDYGEQSVKTKLSVGPHGVRVGKTPGHLYSLNRVTYCAADPHRPKIFAWIYRHQVKNKAVVLRCHAVLLARAEKARALAASLLQNAAAALSEFRRLKRRSDFRHCRQQLLGEGAVPLVPLRRLLNGQCHYRPPDDRPSAAGRLCPIAEEEEEEEEEPGRDLSCSDNGRSCEATPDPATPPFPPPGSCGRILKTAGSI